MSQSAAELTVQDLRDMRRSFSQQELLNLIDRMFTDEHTALDMDVVDAAIFPAAAGGRAGTDAGQSAKTLFRGRAVLSAPKSRPAITKKSPCDRVFSVTGGFSPYRYSER